MEDREAAGAACDGRTGMANARIGRELALLAQEAETEGDIDVFVVAEIALVEAACIQE